MKQPLYQSYVLVIMSLGQTAGLHFSILQQLSGFYSTGCHIPFSAERIDFAALLASANSRLLCLLAADMLSKAIPGHFRTERLSIPFVEDEVSDMAGMPLGDHIEILGHNATI